VSALLRDSTITSVQKPNDNTHSFLVRASIIRLLYLLSGTYIHEAYNYNTMNDLYFNVVSFTYIGLHEDVAFLRAVFFLELVYIFKHKAVSIYVLFVVTISS